jgi:predicted nucleic acid-binding protein
LGFKYAPNDAAALLMDLTRAMRFVELDGKDTRAALALAQKHGIRGGRVDDWMHARAATKAGAAFLVTDNGSDFVGLEDGFKLVSSAGLSST